MSEIKPTAEEFAKLLPKDSSLFLGSSKSLTTHRDTLKLLDSSMYHKV